MSKYRAKLKSGSWVATALLAASILTPVSAIAQTEPVAPPPSESAMVNLVRALVQQKALKPEVGAALIQQAEAEAAQARAVNAQTASNALPDAPAGTIRVPYIPESVRTQIKDELRAEVMKEARVASWASPDEAAPDWTRRITLHGDIRVRSQSELYSKTNSNQIFDFADANSGSNPVDFDQAVFLPILNSRVDRWNRLRVRARLGVDAVIAEGVTAGITIATGNDDGPISTNASLAGGFGKRDLWLDKAWVRVEPTEWSSASFGRFENPFVASDLLYDSDVNFDGVAVGLDSGKMLGEDIAVAVRGGAFPLDFGSANFPALSSTKRRVPHKYLFAAEAEVKAKLLGQGQFAASVGYHIFRNIQGQFSEACSVVAAVEFGGECSTDRLRPFFLTKGNTLSPLRNYVDDSGGTIFDRPQFLGLTFGYNVLDLNASFKMPINESMDVKLAGSYVKNLAFKRSDICRNGLLGQPINNGGTQGNGRDFCVATNPVDYIGGDTGYMVRALVGREKVEKAGEWNVHAAYRYLESDAVLDSLTDSDFHLGGTNAKGYIIGATYGLFDGVSLGGRWLSANEIAGEPFAIDVLQVDLQVKF